DPTGQQDATAAINRAINDARDARLITYLPAGRYLVSDTLVGVQGTVARDSWMFNNAADPMAEYESFNYPCTLVGEGPGKTVVVLAPWKQGFDNTDAPRPVVYFWARGESRDKVTGVADPHSQQANISFNQQIVGIDL